MATRSAAVGVRAVLEGEEVRDVLGETFFAPDAAVVPRTRSTKAKPAHYKVICISMYTQDLARLDDAVKELKRRGFTKANRSAVLRVAMEQLDIDRVRKGL